MTVSGFVKRYSSEAGYGFLSTEDLGDVFVHATALKRDGWGGLPRGADVRAEVVPAGGGMWRVSRVLEVRLAG